MNETQWLSLVAALLVLAILFPGLRALPREGLLRNIVLWLCIFLAIGLFYNAFGPFDVPATQRYERPGAPAPVAEPTDTPT